MSKIRPFPIFLNVFAPIALTLVISSLANAQATRTWVSGVGDDVNPCSRTAPCKTFAGAISKTAKDGEIDALDPGGFGAVTITKSIYINGTHGSGYGSILNPGVNGININITDPNDVRKAVRLRALDLNGASQGVNGVNILAATNVWIEDCIIDGNTGDGTSTGIGVRVAAAANCNVFISDTAIHKNVTAVRITTSSGFALADLKNCNIEGNTTGVDVSTNGFVSIEDSRISSNLADGAKTSASGVQLSIKSTSFTFNGTAINAAAGSIVRSISNNVINNGTGFGGTTAVIQTDGQNRNSGNLTAGAPGGGLITVQ